MSRDIAFPEAPGYTTSIVRKNQYNAEETSLAYSLLESGSSSALKEKLKDNRVSPFGFTANGESKGFVPILIEKGMHEELGIILDRIKEDAGEESKRLKILIDNFALALQSKNIEIIKKFTSYGLETHVKLIISIFTIPNIAEILAFIKESGVVEVQKWFNTIIHNTDSKGKSALFMVCLSKTISEEDKVNAAKGLVACGAKTNVYRTDSDGVKSLFGAAIEAGNLELIKVLVEANNDLLEISVGVIQKPLHLAIHKGQIEIVKYFHQKNVSSIQTLVLTTTGGKVYTLENTSVSLGLIANIKSFWVDDEKFLEDSVDIKKAKMKTITNLIKEILKLYKDSVIDFVNALEFYMFEEPKKKQILGTVLRKIADWGKEYSSAKVALYKLKKAKIFGEEVDEKTALKYLENAAKEGDPEGFKLYLEHLASKNEFDKALKFLESVNEVFDENVISLHIKVIKKTCTDKCLKEFKYKEAIKYLDESSSDYKLVEVLAKLEKTLPYTLKEIKSKFANFKSLMDQKLSQKTFSEDFLRTINFIKLIKEIDGDFFSEAEIQFLVKVELLDRVFKIYNELTTKIETYRVLASNPNPARNKDPKAKEKKDDIEEELKKFAKLIDGQDYPEIDDLVSGLRIQLKYIVYRNKAYTTINLEDSAAIFKYIEHKTSPAKVAEDRSVATVKYDLSLKTLKDFANIKPGTKQRAKILEQLGIDAAAEVDPKLQLVLEGYIEAHDGETVELQCIIRKAVKSGSPAALILKILEEEDSYTKTIAKEIREALSKTSDIDDVASVASSLRVRIVSTNTNKLKEGAEETKENEAKEKDGDDKEYEESEDHSSIADMDDLEGFDDIMTDALDFMDSAGPRPPEGLRRDISAPTSTELLESISEESMYLLRTVYRDPDSFRGKESSLKRLCDELDFEFRETKSGYLILNPESIKRAFELGKDPMHYGANMHKQHGTTYEGLHRKFVENLQRIFKSAAKKYCPEIPLDEVSEITDGDRQAVIEKIMKGSFEVKDAPIILDIIAKSGKEVNERAKVDITNCTIDTEALRDLLTGMGIIASYEENEDIYNDFAAAESDYSASASVAVLGDT